MNYETKLAHAAEWLSRHDLALATVISKTGLPTFRPHTNYYGSLVDSIISQQLSVKAAATIEGRFKALFGSTDFPSPEQILIIDTEALRSVGLSRNKTNYIRDLAEHVLDGRLDFTDFPESSNEQIVAALAAVKGIGEWTAHMFLIFCMGRLDVLPVGDLGIKNGMQKLYNLPNLPTTQEMKQIADANHWHPYESVAIWYIWQSLNNAPTI